MHAHFRDILDRCWSELDQKLAGLESRWHELSQAQHQAAADAILAAQDEIEWHAGEIWWEEREAQLNRLYPSNRREP